MACGKQRLMAVLLVLAMVCSPFSMEVFAEYDTPGLEETIAALPVHMLTADWAQDLLTMARSQIGYTESKTNTMVTEHGQVGYTCYGDYYGLPYGEWCAMFICFCMEFAAIPEDSFPRSAVCRLWLAALDEMHLYRSDEDYIPVPGDIVFFGPTPEKAAHVGIVTYAKCDGDKVETLGVLEGNVEACVAERHYAAAYSPILGYGTLSFAQRMKTLEAEIYTDGLKTAPWDDPNFGIRVSGIFPEDCHAEAFPAELAAESGGGVLSGWNIVLVDRDGYRIQPETGSVFVDITSEEAAAALSAFEEPGVYCRRGRTTALLKKTPKVTETGVSFEADAFGVFALGDTV